MNQVTKYTDFRGNTIKYSYDQIGNLVALTYPGGRIVRYSYYKNCNIKTVTDWDGRVTSYEYDGNGRLTKTTRPDGSVETRTYDAAGRMTSKRLQIFLQLPPGGEGPGNPEPDGAAAQRRQSENQNINGQFFQAFHAVSSLSQAFRSRPMSRNTTSEVMTEAAAILS